MSSFSIRNRLIAAAVIGVVITFLSSTLAVTFIVRQSLHAQFDLDLLAKVRQLAEQVEQHHGKLENEINPRTLADTEAFQLWARGISVDKSANLGEANLVPYPGICKVVLPNGHAADQITWYAYARLEGRHQTRSFAIVLALAAETGDIETSTHEVIVVMIGVGVTGLVFCIAFLVAVVYRGMKPLRALAAAIAAVRVDELGSHLGPNTRAIELRPIASRLDELIARLAAAMARERELTSEVAHELRTPLAGLRATLEVALDHNRGVDHDREAMQRCLAITIETERMATSLLTLARLDSGQAKVMLCPIDFDELVRGILASLHAKIIDRRLELVTKLRPVTITSDPDKLKVVLANLLGNAATYATEGGNITVILEEDRLEVRNTCVDLQPSQLEHVFERFWRGDSARTEAGHAGIGLALVQKLLALLGAAIHISIVGEEFVATVRLDQSELARGETVE